MSDMYHAAESGGENIAFNKWESKSCPFYRDVLMSECYREGQLYCLNKQESFFVTSNYNSLCTFQALKSVFCHVRGTPMYVVYIILRGRGLLLSMQTMYRVKGAGDFNGIYCCC